MEIIAKIVEHIGEELDDAKKYIKMAHKYKIDHPRLADKLCDLAEAEMQHAKILHAEVVRLISEAKDDGKPPPPGMLAVYEYEHTRDIERAAAIRQMIADYRAA